MYGLCSNYILGDTKIPSRGVPHDMTASSPTRHAGMMARVKMSCVFFWMGRARYAKHCVVRFLQALCFWSHELAFATGMSHSSSILGFSQLRIFGLWVLCFLAFVLYTNHLGCFFGEYLAFPLCSFPLALWVVGLWDKNNLNSKKPHIKITPRQRACAR